MRTGASGASRSEDEALLEHLARRTGPERRDLAAVGRVPLFAGELAGLAPLLADAAVRRCSPNVVLFVGGEPAREFYVVLDGWVRLYRQTADGRESLIALFARGEAFAEAVRFLGGTFPVSAATADETRLLIIPAEPFRRALCRSTTSCASG
jgi:CRP-like cAMP-binding protein